MSTPTNAYANITVDQLSVASPLRLEMLRVLQEMYNKSARRTAMKTAAQRIRRQNQRWVKYS